MVKIRSLLGQNNVIYQNLGKWTKIFSLMVSKNYFRFMDKNLVKNVINGVNLVKIGHFLWKWPKLGRFLDQNDVIGQNLMKLGKNFISKSFKKLFQSGLWTKIWSKMSLMGSIWSKYVIFCENVPNWVDLGTKMTS